EKIEPVDSDEEDGGRIKASPLAKKIASENKINLEHVVGSGPGGRIVKKDIEAALESESATAKEIVETSLKKEKVQGIEKTPETGAPLPPTSWLADEVEQKEIKKPLNKLRQA